MACKYTEPKGKFLLFLSSDCEDLRQVWKEKICSTLDFGTVKNSEFLLCSCQISYICTYNQLKVYLRI